MQHRLQHRNACNITQGCPFFPCFLWTIVDRVSQISCDIYRISNYKKLAYLFVCLWAKSRFPEFQNISLTCMNKAQIWNLGYWDPYYSFYNQPPSALSIPPSSVSAPCSPILLSQVFKVRFSVLKKGQISRARSFSVCTPFSVYYPI